MNIDLAELAPAQYSAAIRSHLVCGQCSASTLLCWESVSLGDVPRGTSTAYEYTNDSGMKASVCFLVRCSFFKFNVARPEEIVVCEGFKQRKDAADKNA